MNKTIKAEYLPGGAKREELLDQVPDIESARLSKGTNIYFVWKF